MADVGGFGGGFGETVFGNAPASPAANTGDRGGATGMLSPFDDWEEIKGIGTDHPGVLHSLAPSNTKK